MRFKNKIALVTGATSGIGKKIVERLTKEGCNVIATSKENISLKNNNIVKKIEYYKIDVTSEEEWKIFSNYIRKKYKKIDILINNAGIRVSGDIKNTSLDLWNHIINTNLTSVFLGCKYILPLMYKSKKANIVNLASVTSLRGVKNMLAYAASKSALVTFTSSLALDLAKRSASVNNKQSNQATLFNKKYHISKNLRERSSSATERFLKSTSESVEYGNYMDTLLK